MLDFNIVKFKNEKKKSLFEICITNSSFAHLSSHPKYHAFFRSCPTIETILLAAYILVIFTVKNKMQKSKLRKCF